MCDGYLDCGMHCVMVTRTAQQTVNQFTIVIQKCVYLAKKSRSAIQLLGAANPANFSVNLLFICTLFLCIQILCTYEHSYMTE